MSGVTSYGGQVRGDEKLHFSGVTSYSGQILGDRE